jgi:iron complex transport system substrate-binding protein
MSRFPSRIVCLTEETTETLYLLGQQDRVVGISGYKVRPPEARSKPKVSAFINANYDKILALEPDLVLAFSDLQGDIVRKLIRHGLTGFTFNQRSVAEILDMIRTLARIVGCEAEGAALVDRFERDLDSIRRSAARFPRRPRVFFEEWNDPLISGIRWVDELIEIAGGETVFPELRNEPLARNRILDPAVVISRDPQIVIGSWCGIRFNPDFVRRRKGWDAVSAVRNGHLYEIKSTYILQPGPAALSDGVRQIHHLIARCLDYTVSFNDSDSPGTPSRPSGTVNDAPEKASPTGS